MAARTADRMGNAPVPRRVPLKPAPGRAPAGGASALFARSPSQSCGRVLLPPRSWPGVMLPRRCAGYLSCGWEVERQPEPVSAPLWRARSAGRPCDGAGIVRTDRLDGYGITPDRSQLRRRAGPDRRRDLRAGACHETRVRGWLGVSVRGRRPLPPHRCVRRVHRDLA